MQEEQISFFEQQCAEGWGETANAWTANDYERQEDLNYEKNRLVLYIEEVYKNSTDMKCYIIYDEAEEEYFMCGSRKKKGESQYGDFKLFCKSKYNALDFISFIMNVKESDLNYGLFNYSNLSSIDNSGVDFDVLENMRLSCSEVAFYQEMDYNCVEMIKILNMLKKVRY